MEWHLIENSVKGKFLWSGTWYRTVPRVSLYGVALDTEQCQRYCQSARSHTHNCTAKCTDVHLMPTLSRFTTTRIFDRLLSLVDICHVVGTVHLYKYRPQPAPQIPIIEGAVTKQPTSWSRASWVVWQEVFAPPPKKKQPWEQYHNYTLGSKYSTMHNYWRNFNT